MLQKYIFLDHHLSHVQVMSTGNENLQTSTSKFEVCVYFLIY